MPHFLVERRLQAFGRKWMAKPKAEIISAPAY
jgi:hypothetical protein